MGKHHQHQDGDEPEPTSGELARRCTLCRESIPAGFFTLRGLVVCLACAEKIRQRQNGPSNTRKALLYGAIAAGVTALLWLLASVASSRQLALLAIPAGIAIGLAVHQGSGGRGGLRNQLAAMLLVYAVFVTRSVPPIFGGIADAIKKEHATATADAGKDAEPTNPPVASAPAQGTPATSPALSPPAPPSGNQTSLLATLKAYFVFTAIAWGLVLASPFMPATTNALSLISLAVGMALAFRFNRRPPLRGPF